MVKGAKSICRYLAIVLVLLGLFMFVAPYLMDAASAATGQSVGAVGYFWSSMMWTAVGIVVAGLVLFGASFALKDQ